MFEDIWWVPWIMALIACHWLCGEFVVESPERISFALGDHEMHSVHGRRGAAGPEWKSFRILKSQLLVEPMGLL